jgi:peptidoglycan biosynthesis protein MviN/MurJ (putative lipid II flippase)
LLVNLLLDLILIPSYGYLGACYANIGAYALWFFLSLFVSYRVLGGFSLARVSTRVLPVGLAVSACLLAWHYLNPWADGRLGSPILLTSLEVTAAFILYGVLLYAFKAITLQDIISLREFLGKPHPQGLPPEGGSSPGKAP